MKAVMREMAQAKRHYSKLPLFDFLRSESVAPRDRLAFFPAMAPFILAFSDLNRFVLRDEASADPHQRLVNEHTHEDDHHWPWFLEDLTKLGHDRSTHVTQVLRSYMKDEYQHNRMLMARLAQLVYGTTPTEKLVIVEAIEIPSATPRAEPNAPASALSRKKSRWSWPRVAPRARRIPISDRRCVTAMANEL